ncbi:MAG: diguanylate cyclase [Pyrinomonadaceae bacterium]
MENTNSNSRWRSSTIWAIAISAALPSVVFALARLPALAAEQGVALAVTAALAVFLSRHEPSISRSRMPFPAKPVFVFWTIFWIGAAGAVLVGIAASASVFLGRADRRRRTYTLLTDSLEAAAAGGVYYLASAAASGERGLLAYLVAHSLPPAVYYLLSAIAGFIYLRIDSARPLKSVLNDAFGYSAVYCTAAAAGTIILDQTFDNLGLGVGLVLAPLIILGSLAYSAHQRMLANKVREISEASRIHLATVEALATAIDARDQVGVGHVRRTQIYAIGLGEILGLAERDIHALRTGALLHDIGKLAVPEHILNKSEELTSAEREKTKVHSSVGASILEKVNFDYPVVPTVRYHHEHWDGSGYPEGLRGENIPLTARILAIADAYDSLRSDRPFRRGYTREDARRIMMAEAGIKFDPTLLNLFFSRLGAMEAEVARCGLSYRTDGAQSGDHYVEQIKLANREVFTLYELAREFSSSLDLDDTYSLFARTVRELIPVDTFAIYLLNESTGLADVVHCEGPGKAQLAGAAVKPGAGGAGRALEQRKTVRLSHDDNADDHVAELDFRAAAALPLATDDRVIGAIEVYTNSLPEYGEEHLRLLETVATIAADAIAKSREHAEAERSALTDPITGLPNARSLRRQFEKEAARTRRSGTSLQVLMLDLDGFKQVNDSFGHKTGDVMLTEIAKVITSQLREYDFLARYAGDEYIALVPDTSAQDVRELCQRIDAAVREFVLRVGDSEARVGVSIGAASFPQSGESFDQLLIAADKRMYTTKSVRKTRPRPPAVTHTNYAPVPRPDIPLPDPNDRTLVPDELVSVVEPDVLEANDTDIISSAVN